MRPDADPRDHILPSLRRLGQFSGLALAGAAIAALVGWITGLLPETAPTRPLAALCLILGGAALYAAGRHAAGASPAGMQTQAQLREERDRARACLNAAQVMLLVLDRTGRIETINRCGAAILGHADEAALVGCDWFELAIPPSRREEVRRVFDALMREEASAPEWYENTVRRADGSERLIVWRNALLRDADGRIAGILASGEDVTERRLAEQQARAGEATLSAVLDALPVGVLIADADGRILRDNAAHRALWGTAPGLPGQHTGGRVGWWPETGQPLRAQDWAMSRALRTGEVVRGELVECQRTGTGERRLHLNSAAPVRDADGSIVGGVAVEQDVTERLAQERALRTQSERVELALDAGAIVGTWVWDLPTDHFTADARFAASFNLDPERCRTGLGIEAVVASVHPEDKPRLMAAIAEAIGRGGPYACQYRVMRNDGVYRWIEANGRVEHAADGTPLRFPGVLLDIDERRSAEAERDRITTLLRTFIDAVPGVVYAKDRAGRMLIANRGTSELIGKPPEFYIGRTDAEFLDSPEDAAVIMATDRRIMDSGEVEQVEEQVRLPDGTPAFWLSTKAPLRDAAGRVIGLIGTSVDVSERKREEARQALLMREVDHRAKNALAVVSSVVRLTRQDTVEGFIDALDGRVAALARAHSLLAQERWTGGELGTLAAAELAAYGDAARLSGPRVVLVPDAVQPTAMVLHELATNAAKHGALSLSGGHVSLVWIRRPEGGLWLDWREEGGPPVPGPPSRRGFGSEVLRATAAQLGGPVEFHWDPAGLRCRLGIGAENLVGA
ncbi:PAS domain-containing protein [Rhodospirillum centenum]|uniref:histidine kinase n=1 Tax=Rhodospirillum centenum (strain ATCC 51521 / SW) TaxID=414684 RepID=B6IY83_RHOCS|nr:PAS domain-containing protein [Rhodospirillum centenum]ACJ01257.1 sensory box sensor histidine kinase, putative [Rhodospirillum centenum SW]